jgi:N-acetylglutamate synthase-like GNAT family acetyltransferase
MTIRVFLEPDSRRKRELQERLTQQLPEWFGKTESNAAYARMAESLDGYVAEVDGKRRGLLLMERHSPKSAEIAWMGVEPSNHRRGIGRALCDAAHEACRLSGAKYVFVATLHPDDTYEPYQRTRHFYEAMGFAYVLKEQFPADPANPAAYYLKAL